MSVEVFSNVYKGPFQLYLLLSKEIGQDVENQSKIADLAFQAAIRYLEYTENFKKPNEEDVILKPLQSQINEVLHYVCTDPSLADHISVISHSITALLWIQKQDPVSFLEDILEQTKSYTDVLLVFFKDKEPHVEWVEAWLETLNDLNNFVRRQYPKGLTWKGEDDLPEHPSNFHTNQQPGTVKKHQGIFQQDGTKWKIEHQFGPCKQFTVNQADLDNVVYIYDCLDVSVVVENKINSIKIYNAKKISVIFRSLISGVEMVGCQNVKLHAFGKIPSLIIESCSDVNVHLTKSGLNAEVTTSQCSNISLSYPMEDGYYKTFYIPNRLMTKINENRTLINYPIIDG